MRAQRGLNLVGALALVLLLSGLTPASASADPPRPTPGAVGAAPRAALDPYVPGADLVLRRSASFSFAAGGLPFDAVDVEVSRSWATAATMAAFEPYATGVDPDRSVELPIAAGQVLCLHYRESGTADPWLLQCLVRPRTEEAFVRAGRTTLVAHAGYGDGVALSGKGRLLVPKLTAGMHVAVVVGHAPDWPFNGVPRWRNPGGTESVTSSYVEPEAPVAQVFPVTGSGTGRIFTGTRAATAPLVAVAVYPTWYQFHEDLFPTHYSGAPWLVEPAFDGSPKFLPDGTALVRFSHDLSAGWSLDVQVRRGDSRSPAPAWKPLDLPDHTTAVRLPLRPGQAVCVRYRAVSPGGDPKKWSGTDCTARPYDDTVGRVRGSARQVDEPYFADGSATMLAPGSSLSLAVPRGSAAGAVYHVREGSSHANLRLLFDGRLPGASQDSVGPAGWPSLTWLSAKRDGILTVRAAGAPRERVSGLLVVPAWALRGYDFN